jgi:hypothetical protein
VAPALGDEVDVLRVAAQVLADERAVREDRHAARPELVERLADQDAAEAPALELGVDLRVQEGIRLAGASVLRVPGLRAS